MQKLLTHTIKATGLHRLLVRQDVNSLELGRDELTVRRGNQKTVIDLADAVVESSATWAILRRLRVSSPSGTFMISGLTTASVAHIQLAISKAKRRKTIFSKLTAEVPRIRQLAADWNAMQNGAVYLTASRTDTWVSQLTGTVLPDDDDADIIDHLPKEDAELIRRLTAMSNQPRKTAADRNARYVAAELIVHKKLFDEIESNPLTDQQRAAILHDEDNTW